MKPVGEDAVTVAARMREDARRQATREREREGVHYVSVISRIRRVFSICSKAPLVRRAAFRAWARAPPKRTPGEEGGGNREKRGR